MMDELDTLRAELAHYKQEKEQIRDVIGQIGGKSKAERDKVINAVFLVTVVGVFVFDIIRHVAGLDVPYLPPSLLLETAVLLVSVKIIWMIHRQSRVDHFQFWMLNSIEFRMNMVSRRLASLEQTIRDGTAAKAADNPADEAGAP